MTLANQEGSAGDPSRTSLYFCGKRVAKPEISLCILTFLHIRIDDPPPSAPAEKIEAPAFEPPPSTQSSIWGFPKPFVDTPPNPLNHPAGTLISCHQQPRLKPRH